MSEPLRRQSLAERVADKIEAAIREGRGWKDILPGYRTLAEHFGTSPKTCMAAMEILEVRRVVKPAQQGQRRQIMKVARRLPHSAEPSEAPVRRAGLLIVSSSVTPITEEGWYAIRRYGDCWIRDGSGVNLAQVDYGRYRQPGSLLKSLIEKHQAGALLVHCAPERWIRAAVDLLPTYLMGGERGGIECSGDSFICGAK